MPGKRGTAWQTLCEPQAQRTFKGRNPAAHSGMVYAKFPGCGRQGTTPGKGEKKM
ncbi:hypothetical protein NUKP76_42420 [Klebsiella variicola]|nr:hypothetical protein NUKP6_07850 [Klebsiella variicola]GKI77709.1 hypothetical protein NUKP18_02560 [Klebsiella variicola]GKJ04646.1 hypothetical protein NUKP23_14050 [Klebsiella variicola]GKJ24075.1 hypothetical protein NUKP24_09930 [Klebsiella variicola]GKK09215.1 hypothetical protein NUKP38_14450 [Klebsiella variicola]